MAENVWHSPSWPTTMEKTDEKRDNTQQKRIPHSYRTKAKKRSSREPTFPALGREDQQILDEISSQQQRSSKDKETSFPTSKWNNGVSDTFPQDCTIGVDKQSAEITALAKADTQPVQMISEQANFDNGKRAPSIIKTAPSKKEGVKTVSFAVPDYSTDEEEYQQNKSSKYMLDLRHVDLSGMKIEILDQNNVNIYMPSMKPTDKEREKSRYQNLMNKKWMAAMPQLLLAAEKAEGAPRFGLWQRFGDETAQEKEPEETGDEDTCIYNSEDYTDTESDTTDTDASYDSDGSYEPGLSPSEIEEEREYIRAKCRNRLIIGGLLLGCIVYFGASYYSPVEEVIPNSYWECFKTAILPQEDMLDNSFWGSVKRAIFPQQEVLDNTIWGSIKRGLSWLW